MQNKNVFNHRIHRIWRNNKAMIRMALLLILILSIFMLFVSSLGISPKTTSGLPKNIRFLLTAPVMTASFSNQEIITVLPKDLDFCVAIDPGHGGVDPGCFYEETHEDDINWSIALLVKSHLEKLGFRVVLTREENETVSIEERLNIVHAADADVLISIHQNALEDDTVTSGVETWYYKKGPEESRLLSEFIQRETIAATDARDRGLRPDRSLIITRKAKIPACLIETGFITSTEERAKLESSQYQGKIAKGIVLGIVRFFEAQE